MKVALAISLNGVLVAVLWPWLRRQWRWAGPGWWQVVFVLGLGLRIGVGMVRNWTLHFDAEYMNRMSEKVTAQLWSDPGGFYHTFTGAITVFHFKYYDAVYQSTSNTWILIKLLALLNLASLGVGWLNGLYLSIFAFVGCWKLVRILAERLPRTPAGAGAVAFLLWPSGWFWATGLSKEAVLLGSGTWLVARALGAMYEERNTDEPAPAWRWARWWLGTIALVLLHFYMRYFFAMPLLGVLVGIGLAHGLQRMGLGRRHWVQALALAMVLGIGVWLAPQLSVAFRINKFTHQVVQVYADELASADQLPHMVYPDLRPTVESIAAHAPRAAFNALTRPWLGESRQLLYIASSLENLLLLALLGLAVVALARGRGGRFPFIWGLGLSTFCLTLAILVGLTTPIFGLLSRYRSEMIPFLVLLVLQNDYVAVALRWLARHQPNKQDLDHRNESHSLLKAGQR